jgi:hypothetical protein
LNFNFIVENFFNNSVIVKTYDARNNKT